MAIMVSVESLLSGRTVEWARIEYKATWDPATSLKTICAFANDIDNWGTGYLVIGVEEEDGRPKLPVLGIPEEQIDAVMKDLLNKCKLITPEYLPVVAPVEYGGKTLIVTQCSDGSWRPYSCPARFTHEKGKAVPSKERAYFIRKMSSTVQAQGQELQDLFALASRIPFDDRTNHEASMADLNLTLIKSYLAEAGSALAEEADTLPFEELCRDMGICTITPEYVKPRNVGLMFFSMQPEKYIPYARIDVVQFPDGAGGDEIIERIFRGPLHQQLRDALLFIRNNVLEERVFKRPDRAEADRFFNWPYVAIEEALANAVYHKGYDVREPIEVRVEGGTIEIVSFPGPDRSVTPEGLREFHVTNRHYRNRRIGEFLKEIHLTEGRNTGFRKILRALEANGSPMPEFETDEERSYFITRLFRHPAFAEEGSGDKSATSDKSVDKSVDKQALNDESVDKVAIHRQKITEVIKELGAVKAGFIGERLGLGTTRTRQLLAQMVADGLIEAHGERKGRYYCLPGSDAKA